jgi:hypothetical protein
MNNNTNNTPNPCIFIFDSTRLRSHLFFRYLTTSPQANAILHPFIAAATFGREHKSQHMRHSAQRQKELEEVFAPLLGDDTFQSCSEAFSAAVEAMHTKGKVPVANEHWFNVCKIDIVLGLLRGEIHEPGQLGRNPTHMPDENFDSLQPVILIRHPAISIGSIYRDAVNMTALRPGDEDFDMICMNKPLRLLFDYFRAQGRQPVVVDAEDILWRTEGMSWGLCVSLGTIDSGSLSDTWEPASQDEVQSMNPVMVMLMKNILESSGIERPSEKVSPESRC